MSDNTLELCANELDAIQLSRMVFRIKVREAPSLNESDQLSAYGN